MTSSGHSPDVERRLGWPGLVGLLVTFALLPAFVSVLFLHARSDARFPDQASVNDRALTAGIGALVVVLAVTWLRWWPVVLHERLRARRWVWVVPISVLVVSIPLIDYDRAGRAGGWVIGGLLAATLLIAAGEELMFRGVVLVFLRLRYAELVAAVGSSVLFGLAHFLAGPVQVVFSIAFGYLLYLVRRVSGGLVLPIVVHAAWDFSVFSSATTADPASGSDASVALAILTVVLVLLVVVAHRWINPSTSAPAGPVD
jgi:membrane protease YdiL (CAAX protease family)